MPKDASAAGAGSAASGGGGEGGRTNANKASVGEKDFRRTTSFGSASSLSTMTSTAASGRGRGGGAVGAGSAASGSRGGNVTGGSTGGSKTAGGNGDDIPLATNTSATASGDLGGEYSSVWDQDEIDLWTATANTSLKTTAAVTAGEDDRPSRRRGNRGQNWDALRSAVTQAGTAATLGTTQQLYPQQTLPLVHPDALPAPSLSLLSTKDSSVEEKTGSGKGGAAGGGRGSVIVDDGKQHWMPDKLCRHCYSCEAPFTLIRRKHHCRVCGMIFCSACSAYFVRISSSDGIAEAGGKTSLSGTMRTCKMCFDHLSERGLGVIIRGGDTASEDTTNQRSDVVIQPSEEYLRKKTTSSIGLDKLPEAAALRSSMTRKESSRDVLLSTENDDVTKAISDSAPATTADLDEPTIAEQLAGFQAAGGASLGTSAGEFEALSMMKQRLDEERRKREELERKEAEEEAAFKAAEEAALAHAAAEAEKAKHKGVGGQASLLLKKSIGSVRQLKRKNLEQSKNTDEGETINADVDAVEVSVGGGATDATATSLLREQHPPHAAEGIEEALAFGPGQSNDAKQTAKIHLGMVAADYLEKLARELLQTDAPLLLEEIKDASSGSSSPAVIESKLVDLWVNTLMTLATRCCATVEPDVKNGDLLDIRPYCKVKVIPGGSVEDSAYMSGIMFHKNVSHKKMARVIQNAKIMMLSGGIEYTRTENRIASLDTLLEQEERYMEILVTKIFKLKPDVLIVGKSVCRKAQELLLRADIALIQYVKPSLLTRIARQTGATVLSSIDHVMNSAILGELNIMSVNMLSLLILTALYVSL